MPINLPEFVTAKQAADSLQVTTRTIFNLLKSGQLKSVKIGASRRIPVSELQRLIAD